LKPSVRARFRERWFSAITSINLPQKRAYALILRAVILCHHHHPPPSKLSVRACFELSIILYKYCICRYLVWIYLIVLKIP
jgi:hypothetical protein